MLGARCVYVCLFVVFAVIWLIEFSVCFCGPSGTRNPLRANEVYLKFLWEFLFTQKWVICMLFQSFFLLMAFFLAQIETRWIWVSETGVWEETECRIEDKRKKGEEKKQAFKNSSQIFELKILRGFWTLGDGCLFERTGEKCKLCQMFVGSWNHYICMKQA